MEPTLTKLWVNEFEGRKELRASFSNDRHHATLIDQPHGTTELAQALYHLANQIRRDPHLSAAGQGRAATLECRQRPEGAKWKKL